MSEHQTTRTDLEGAVQGKVEISPAEGAAPSPRGPASRPEAPQEEASRAEASQPQIHLSSSALDQIRQMIRDEGLEEEGGLRLRARMGAGCSAPLQYGLFLEEAPEPDDTVLSNGDVRIFMDPESAWVLDGLQVDYVESPVMGEGFAFRHPNGPGGRAC